MAWDPSIYNKFKSQRSAPFYDLFALVQVRNSMDVIDLGCGTGELTKELSEKLPGAYVLGIDSSGEMLADSKKLENEKLHFGERSIEQQLMQDAKWDLVFSNAAIQWVDDHAALLPCIIKSIKKGGQLAIQVPAQHHNITNILLDKLAEKEPYKIVLQNWKRDSSVLNIDSYAKIFFENGSRSMNVFEKIYPLVLENADALFDWVSGTALIPYLERLPIDMQENFKDDYKACLKQQFNTSPVFYPFKRILMAAAF